MKLATWNVNGIRARETQVREWIQRDRPDVICLQEIKATAAQVPATLAKLDGYWSLWHGAGGYSGVSLQLARERFADEPRFSHPAFDHETRVVVAELGRLVVASVYVPNGGKDFPPKLRFLEALAAWAREVHARGQSLILAGDLNVTRGDIDVHPKERKLGVIGQRPDERAALENLLAQDLVDVGRTLAPNDDQLYTWWPPWRSMRQKNIGWRIDYVLASTALARGAEASTVLKDIGTSDHAPVAVTFAGLD